MGRLVRALVWGLLDDLFAVLLPWRARRAYRRYQRRVVPS